jgi:uncharacterized membrane protein YphA (DoxX/SURF4 family)
MRTNPFYDAWLFVSGQTSDHANSGAGPLLALLFLSLLAASVFIARRVWQQDPLQRSPRDLAIWLMRAMIGGMWFQGSLWKLPLPVAGGFQHWTQELTRYAAFEWHKWLATEVFLPLISVINPLVYLTELSLAVAYILGLLVRPFAIIGMLFVLHLWLGLYHHPQEWPWLYVFLIFVQGFFLVTNAGKSLGLDALLSGQPGLATSKSMLARIYRRLA